MELTKNQQLVYQALLEIPKGKVVTYGELGRHLGLHPRTVGMLLGKNPYPDRYPCCKVVGYDGALTGFSLGLADKERRLKAEGIRVIDGKVPKEYFHYFV
ncbi:MAG: MGMT family protein [Candidatus Absconditabacteria bacterium]|nr:MGMT family protein [Candidatus Absconditabacteria bacterium]MDD3868382.1 MGMT family protein [Candidatus Absconditabacteria bacterium]MDD4714465.1 MGMT family protein [Candidatus Absconditabacteria bacterium]